MGSTRKSLWSISQKLWSIFYFKNISESKACDKQSPDLGLYYESEFHDGLKEIQTFRICPRKFFKTRFSLMRFDFRFGISVKFRVEWCIRLYDSYWICLRFPTNSYLRRREYIRNKGNFGKLMLSCILDKGEIGVKVRLG